MTGSPGDKAGASGGTDRMAALNRLLRRPTAEQVQAAADEQPMGGPVRWPGGFAMPVQIERILGFGRSFSFWPLLFGLSCCAIEMMALGGDRFDMSRFGMEAMRASPRQADGMMVAAAVLGVFANRLPAAHRRRHLPRQPFQPARRLRFRLPDAGQFRQRVRLGKRFLRAAADADHAAQSNAGNLQSAAALRDLPHALAHERRAIYGAFPGYYQVRLTQTALDPSVLSEQIKARCEFCPQKRLHPKAQPARGASARHACEVAPQLLLDHPRQAT